jgi:hypothetical protein
VSVGIPQCIGHSLYGSTSRGPEDDSVETKHVALLSYCTLYILASTIVVFDWPFPHYIVQTLRGGTPQVLRRIFTSIHLKQTMLVGHIKLQLFSDYNLWCT